jgi:hypothetical protein
MRSFSTFWVKCPRRKLNAGRVARASGTREMRSRADVLSRLPRSALHRKSATIPRTRRLQPRVVVRAKDSNLGENEREAKGMGGC